MKEYEVVRQLYNSCTGTERSTSVTIDEVATDDPEQYVISRYAHDKFTCTREVRDDGSLFFEVNLSGIIHRYTFVEL